MEDQKEDKWFDVNDKIFVALRKKLENAGVKIEVLDDIKLSTELLGQRQNSVYKGEYKGKSVAVKVIPKITVRKRSEAFYRDMAFSTNTSHDRVLKVHCIAFAPKDVYVVLDEVTNNKTLDKKCQEVKDYKQKINYFIQLVSIVKDLHEMKLIHRDLCPTSVLINEKNIVYLTDFGFSKEIVGDAVTATIDSKGTTKYMPPECFIFDPDSSVDERDLVENVNITFYFDIWSIGVTISECLSGVAPWSNINWDSFDYKGLDIKKKTEIRDISIVEFLTTQKINFPIPNELEEPIKKIITSCLDLKKENRPSAEDLLKLLEDYYKTL